MPNPDHPAYHSTAEKISALTLGSVEGSEHPLRFRHALLLSGTEAGAAWHRKAAVSRAHRYAALSVYLQNWGNPREIAQWALLGKWGPDPQAAAARELTAGLSCQKADGTGPLLNVESRLVWSEARRLVNEGQLRAPHEGRGVIYTVAVEELPGEGLLDLDLPLSQQKSLAVALKGKYRFNGSESGRDVMARLSAFLPDAEGGAARSDHNGYADQAATFLGKLGCVGLRYTPRYHGTVFPVTGQTCGEERMRDWRGDAAAQAWVRPAVSARADPLVKDLILFDATRVTVESERVVAQGQVAG